MDHGTDSDPPRGPRAGARSGRTPEHDSEKVAQAYARGEVWAFDLVESWIRGALRNRYGRLQDELDDLCQTVHEKLLTNLRENRFQGNSSLRTYLTSIALYTAIDRLRELYQQRALTEAVAARSDESLPPNPYGRVQELDERKVLHQVMLSLPVRCRELWQLVFVERLSYDEIGRRLSIPAGTVKSRMWHCRRQATALIGRLEQIRGRRAGS